MFEAKVAENGQKNGHQYLFSKTVSWGFLKKNVSKSIYSKSSR